LSRISVIECISSVVSVFNDQSIVISFMHILTYIYWAWL